MSAEGVRKLKAAFLNKAREDAAVIKRLVVGAPELTGPIGFHAQQAVEKAVKAVLVARGVRLVRTHNLERLSATCKAAGITVPVIKTDLKALTAYAVEWRYVEADIELPSLDFDTLTEDIETVLAWAEREISK
jgi:HEPN domain-containing protein